MSLGDQQAIKRKIFHICKKKKKKLSLNGYSSFCMNAITFMFLIEMILLKVDAF